MLIVIQKSRVLQTAVLTAVFFATLLGCKKELTPENTASDIVYNPLGQGALITKVISGENNSIYSVVNNFGLLKYEGDDLKHKWTSYFQNGIVDIVKGNNNEIIIIENNYVGGEYSFKINRLDATGNMISNSPVSEKIIPQETGNESLAGACSDHNGGLYMIVLIENNGATTRYLAHATPNSTIDRRTRLNDFVVYLQCDEQDNVYLIRTYGGTGSDMLLEAYKLNRNEYLSNNKIKKDWSYKFVSLEPDWKWTRYFPFKFAYSASKLFIIKQQNTGQNDECTGLDVIALNTTDGTESYKQSIPFEFVVNNYHNQSTFYPTNSHNELFIGINYGSKARLTRISAEGTIVSQTQLSGESNSCIINGIGSYGNRIYIGGMSTLLKSPVFVPFAYSHPIK